MKKWLLERFLPMWAKETLWKDYRALRRENARLRRQILQKEAYIKGLHKAFSLERRLSNAKDKMKELVILSDRRESKDPLR